MGKISYANNRFDQAKTNEDKWRRLVVVRSERDLSIRLATRMNDTYLTKPMNSSHREERRTTVIDHRVTRCVRRNRGRRQELQQKKDSEHAEDDDEERKASIGIINKEVDSIGHRSILNDVLVSKRVLRARSNGRNLIFFIYSSATRLTCLYS